MSKRVKAVCLGQVVIHPADASADDTIVDTCALATLRSCSSRRIAAACGVGSQHSLRAGPACVVLVQAVGGGVAGDEGGADRDAETGASASGDRDTAAAGDATCEESAASVEANEGGMCSRIAIQLTHRLTTLVRLPRDGDVGREQSRQRAVSDHTAGGVMVATRAYS